MAEELNRPPEIYEKLWQEAVKVFDSGNPRLDPFLKDRANDRRRGVTLIARPDSAVRDRVAEFLREASKIAPEQYFYQPSEFHLTVLAVIPGSEFWQEPMKRLPDFLVALNDVLKNRPAFSIRFRGITASPETVMIQGFPATEDLLQLRNDLRAALAKQGLGENLDRRYKIVTAHLTVIRFSTPMKDWKPFKAFLAAHRNTDFGETRVCSLELIEGDWYASADTARLVKEYPLN
ncbi:MAG TPA: 2'-5' RNA ligase family protein [Verrucomicrobiae bacterium]|nr:2'-5' RNA ligase family protein [Verrucomicrobiae bacterium]